MTCEKTVASARETLSPLRFGYRAPSSVGQYSEGGSAVVIPAVQARQAPRAPALLMDQAPQAYQGRHVCAGASRSGICPSALAKGGQGAPHSRDPALQGSAIPHLVFDPQESSGLATLVLSGSRGSLPGLIAKTGITLVRAVHSLTACNFVLCNSRSFSGYCPVGLPPILQHPRSIC